MSTRNQMPTFNSFTITQPFLGAPLQFQPALGSRELEELIDAYVVGNACKQDKLSTVTIDFYNHATVDINTGSLVRRYDVMPWAFDQSPSQSQSSGLSPPIFTPSPASSATFADSTHSSMSTPSHRTRGSRVTKKTKKDTTKKSAETRLPGFSIMTKDGIDVTNSAGRGTKTKEQREHAHLMRIIKACDECKRKKIRCDPSHRRSSRTDMSRASASIRPSPPSQSNPSPAASTPSLSRETTQGSEQSSPPVDSFAIEDFVLFPEDDLNQWNPEMSIPGFDTQYSDFSMTNYDSFPDFDTSFSTMNDNLSFDFPSFDQSSSFSPQLLNNTNNFSNYHNTQPLTHSDVNSQYISSTQPLSDLDFFESFCDLQNFSPTYSQQAHPQAVADEDPGKINNFVPAPAPRSRVNNVLSISPTTISQTDGGASAHDFPTSFSFSPTDSCYQSQDSEYGFVNTGPDDAYGNVPGLGVDSGVEQSPQSGPRDSASSNKEHSRSQRTKHQVLLDRERSRVDDHDRQLVNAFPSSMGESHVPRASAEQLVSSPGVFNDGDGLAMNIDTSRGLESSCSPVPGETPWSLESKFGSLTSLAKSSLDALPNTMESNTGDGTLAVVKSQEYPDAHASSNSSTTILAPISRAAQIVGNYVQSRRANLATSSSDRQVSSVNTNIVYTHVAVSSSVSSSRSKPIVESMAQAIAGVVATGALVVPDRVKIMTSPRFSLVDKFDKKVSSSSTEKFSSGSLDNCDIGTIVSKEQNTSAIPSASPSLNVNIPGHSSTLVKNSTKAVTAPATTALCNVSTLAALALCLAATAVVSRCLESSAMALVVYVVASACFSSSCTVSRPEKSIMSTFISASIWNSWSDMKQKIGYEHQRVLKGKNHKSLDAAGKMMKKFSLGVSI